MAAEAAAGWAGQAGEAPLQKATAMVAVGKEVTEKAAVARAGPGTGEPEMVVVGMGAGELGAAVMAGAGTGAAVKEEMAKAVAARAGEGTGVAVMAAAAQGAVVRAGTEKVAVEKETLVAVAALQQADLLVRCKGAMRRVNTSACSKLSALQ